MKFTSQTVKVTTPSLAWTINHVFLSTPVCDVTTTVNGVVTKILPYSVKHISTTQMLIEFSEPTAGTVRLVGQVAESSSQIGVGQVDPGQNVSCFNELFMTLNPYYSVSGDAAPFSLDTSVYGLGVKIVSQNSNTDSALARDIPLIKLGTITFKARLDAVNAADGPELQLIDTANSYTVFALKLSTKADADRAHAFWRDGLSGTTTETTVLASQLVVGRWYSFSLYQQSGNAKLDVLDLTTNTTTTVTIGTFMNDNRVNRLEFITRTGGATSEGSFTGISVCRP